MKSLLTIELSQVNRQIVIVVDCDAERVEQLAKEVRALDPNRAELWQVSPGCLGSFDEMFVVPAPSAIRILKAVRGYVGSKKSEAAAQRFYAVNHAGRRVRVTIPESEGR